jgi:hypothetical protein
VKNIITHTIHTSTRTVQNPLSISIVVLLIIFLSRLFLTYLVSNRSVISPDQLVAFEFILMSPLILHYLFLTLLGASFLKSTQTDSDNPSNAALADRNSNTNKNRSK